MAPVGGKAAGLLRLKSLARVPPFVVLPAGWIAQHADLQSAVVARVEAASLRGPFAVRSSGDDEDGATAAYAGMFETQLGVATADLAAAVRRVAASGTSVRVDSYRSALGLVHNTCAVHVIVQEMVPADIAGVAFSRHPQVADAVLVEAVLGVGDVLVAGEAQPEAVTVDRATRTVVSRTAGRQYVRLDLAGVRTRLSGLSATEERMSDGEALAIADLVMGLELHFAEAVQGVDVEWAIAHGDIYTLQCRPITTACQART